MVHAKTNIKSIINKLNEKSRKFSIRQKSYSYFVFFVLIIMITFSVMYILLHNSETDFYQEGNNFNNFGDSVYYSFIKMLTIGFGHYSPQTSFCRLLTCTQVLFFWGTVLYFTITVTE
jgi:L-cystine uptake protein TcyP (sodium:dicarboxylate symporter family)